MTEQTPQTTLPTSVVDNPDFYALRPEWLDSDKERAAFKAQFPKLVAKNQDCWEVETAQA